MGNRRFTEPSLTTEQYQRSSPLLWICGRPIFDNVSHALFVPPGGTADWELRTQGKPYHLPPETRRLPRPLKS